jgi:segregation and condensation protein B
LVKVENEDEATARIEAALYSAGRPLKIEELIRASGTESRTKTHTILTSTVKKYASKPVLPKATLKTLSYIAYMQPISSKQLVETRGSGVYSHLKELRQLDFINHQNVGRLKIYTTTEKFQKYFGIQGDVENLKQRLFSKIRKTATQSNPKSQVISEIV